MRKIIARIGMSCDTPPLAAGLALLSVALAFPMEAQPQVGLVGGVIRDSVTGNPLAEAQIVAHNLDNGADQSTVSRADGIFTLTHLDPGHYEVLASRKGYRRSSARVAVGVRQIARVELSLESAAPETGGDRDNPPLTPREREMLDRIDRLEKRLASMDPKDTAAAVPCRSRKRRQPTKRSPRPPRPRRRPHPPPARRHEHSVCGLRLDLAERQFAPARSPLDSKYFSGEFRADTFYGIDFNQPKDHSMGGSSEVFRSGEVQ